MLSIHKSLKITRLLCKALTLLLIPLFMQISLQVSAGEYSSSTFSKYVDSKGNISLPKDFRLSMTHLGSWFVPEGGASGFHDVYTEPESARYFRKMGKFPDGATLVKELRSADSGDYTTGSGVSYATGVIKQWFVMIKDTKERFKENPVWGDGWGWALIKTEDPSVNLSKSYKADCIACHTPAKNNDWVYVEAYPTLSKTMNMPEKK